MLSEAEKEQYDKEITTGLLDAMLNEAEGATTARPGTSKPRALPAQTSILENTFTVTNQFEKPKIVDKTNTGNLENSIYEILSSSSDLVTMKPKTPMKRNSTEPIMPNNRREFREDITGGAFFAQPKFYKALTEAMLKNYSVQMTIMKSDDKSSLQIPIYTIEFKSGDEININNAKNALNTLFGAVQTKLADEQAGFWTKNPMCVRVVQEYGNQNEHLHILCEYLPIGLAITYFNKEKSTVLLELCTDDRMLETILQEKFSSMDIPLPTTSDLTKDNKSHLAQDILKLENEMQSQTILMILEQRRIRLFGLAQLVKHVEEQVKKIKEKYASNTVKINLEPLQIKYLLEVCTDELKTLETTYQNTKILETINNGEFTAPSFLHDALEQQIVQMTTLCPPVHLQIEKDEFRVIAHNEYPNLIKIGKQYKCQVDVALNTHPYLCEIPKATVKDHVSKTLTASAIAIHQDDLAEQKVDLVVVSPTSALLLDNILEKAGSVIHQEYLKTSKQSPTEPFETDSGQLKCRKLLFLKWDMDKSSNEAFYRSIRNFVTTAVRYAIKAHHTSIAFPAIGCGGFNIDKNIIANEMLTEAQKQLLRANVLLQIIFVILPDQNEVYKAFQTKLDSLQKEKVEPEETQFSYKLTTLSATIISSSVKKQEQCKQALLNHVENSSVNLELYHQDGLRRWTQRAINAFYKFCFTRQVIVDMNITIGYLKLLGSRDSVIQAEIEYYRIQAKQSEQARLAVIARDIVWAYKINDSTSEKYSPELNARIEDAYAAKMSEFAYNINEEEYTISFATMTETCPNNQIQRQVIRHADFNLPEHWEVQIENIAQFQVKIGSPEYQQIQALFDKTMSKKYTEILHIDRIQNKQWYMQYSSYKSFSSTKDTEQMLFHGCPTNVAQLIIHSFFNRSFSGVNGVVYGQGAYFSAKACYSHNYAIPNPQTGERCMFVVNVLVGKTIKGDHTMKTPPTGYDSTTDGDHIFVTYRDDQAYGSYLIVYK